MNIIDRFNFYNYISIIFKLSIINYLNNTIENPLGSAIKIETRCEINFLKQDFIQSKIKNLFRF